MVIRTVNHMDPHLQKLDISSTVEIVMQSDTKYLHALASIPSVTGKTLRALAAHFQSFEDAWRADEGDFQRAGLDEKAITAVSWKRPSLDPDREMETLVRKSIWLIRETDSDYPLLLAQIPNPPFILYGTGRATLFDSQISFGVVGSRKPTSYGIQATELITETLARAGACIISGLALGIDAIAHRTAVEAGGATVAVLGSGIDDESLYPQSNRGLARRITESGGMVISEYPPGTPALKEHFPARNRIISGLSKGILVVEAQEKSGALITARFALEQNRDVFAVPGSIFSLSSKGTNALIQEGAKLVSCGEDILKEYGIEYTTNTGSLEPLDETEERILVVLVESRTVDDIKTLTGLDTPAIIASVSLLEMKGRIRATEGERYERIL